MPAGVSPPLHLLLPREPLRHPRERPVVSQRLGSPRRGRARGSAGPSRAWSRSLPCTRPRRFRRRPSTRPSHPRRTSRGQGRQVWQRVRGQVCRSGHRRVPRRYGVISLEANAGLPSVPLILEGTGLMDRNARLRCPHRGEDRLHRRNGDVPCDGGCRRACGMRASRSGREARWRSVPPLASPRVTLVPGVDQSQGPSAVPRCSAPSGVIGSAARLAIPTCRSAAREVPTRPIAPIPSMTAQK